MPDVKPAEDHGCNAHPCSATDSSASGMSSTVPAERPSYDVSFSDVLPTRTPVNRTVRSGDVTPSNENKMLTATSVDDVTIMAPSVSMETATAKTSTVPQTTTTTATTTTAAATTTTTATTITRATVIISYRWMALFWDQVSLHSMYLL